MKHISNLLTRLRRSSRRTPSARRSPRRTPLNVERLDLRAVPAVVADYGVDGLWRYTPESGGWSQLTGANPEDIATAADGNVVVADFGGNGLWLWRVNVGWSQLTGADAQNIDVANNATVIADFGGNGLWRWNPAAGWRQMSGADADDVLVSDNGRYILGDFGPGGLWRFSVNSDTWGQLPTALNAEKIGIANDGTSFVYEGDYLRRYSDSGEIVQLDLNPSIYWISATGDGTLYAGYVNPLWNSVWRWTPTPSPTGTWTQLSYGVTPFTGVNVGAGYDANIAYVDYGAYGVTESQGLWIWNNLTDPKWTRIRHTAEQIAAG